MKIGISWLHTYCNFYKFNISLMCSQLTKIGFEVEKLTKENLTFCENVVVGKIISISSFISEQKKSKIFFVKIKKNKYIKIIYFDKDFFSVGDKVAVALKNSIVYKNFFLMKNKKKKIFSKGIFCSYKDLKLIGNFNRLIYFSKEIRVGTLLKKIFLYKSKKQYSLSLSITNNRNDCLSVIGLTRELCALNNCVLKKHQFFSVIPKIKSHFQYFFKNQKFYNNYFSRIINNINLNIKTPFWILEKLRFCDVKPINIIQDIINYVSIKFNQTFHVFDCDKIQEKIILRTSKENEKFNFSHKESIILKKKFLVISDKDKILSLGNGIVNSGIVSLNSKTKNIYIGTGNFCASENLKINSYFYEKNQIFDKNIRLTSFKLQIHSLEYITSLILLYSGGNPSKIAVFKKQCMCKKEIKVFYQCLYKILGINISLLKFFKILKLLNYKIIEKSKLFVILKIPSFRFDLFTQEDIIADFLRLYNVDKIKLKSISTILQLPKKNKKYTFLKKMNCYFSNLGYSEVINYSFENFNWKKIFFVNRKPVKILNPISKDYYFLRSSLWPGLIRTILYNQNRQQDSLKIFESGFCFFKNKNKNKKIKQINYFSGALSGYIQKKTFFFKKKFFDFYSFKYDLEHFLKNFLNFKESLIFKKEIFLGLNPSNSVSIFYKNKKIGCAGMLDFFIQKKYSIDVNIFLFEFLLDDLFFERNKKFYHYTPFFPKVERDISLIVPDHLLLDKLIITLKKVSKKIVSAYIFDIYQGKKIVKNKKSVSIRIIFQSFKRTLCDKEINIILNNCLNILYKKYQAEIRKS